MFKKFKPEKLYEGEDEKQNATFKSICKNLLENIETYSKLTTGKLVEILFVEVNYSEKKTKYVPICHYKITKKINEYSLLKLNAETIKEYVKSKETLHEFIPCKRPSLDIKDGIISVSNYHNVNHHDIKYSQEGCGHILINHEYEFLVTNPILKSSYDFK